MAATGQVVVGRLDFCLMTGTAFVVDRNVVGVGVVLAIGDAGQDAELLTVGTGELAGKAFGRCGQDTVVVLVFLRKFVGAVAHVGDDLQTKFLRFGRLAVVLACQCHQAFGQADETDAQRARVDDGGDGVVGAQLVASQPQGRHEQRELLGEGGLLEFHTFVQLACGDVEHGVELGEEAGNAFLGLGDVHALDGQTDDVDGGERQVSSSDRRLRTETVLEDAGAASHGGYFVQVSLRVVGLPFLALVEGGIQVEEVGEEATGCYLAGQLVEVVVAIVRQIADAPFLFPDLDGEDGSFAIAHTAVGAVQQFADDAASFGRGVCTVVDGAEHDLVSTT